MPDDRIPIVQSNRAEIDTFFAKARALATATKSVPDSRPRLIFALDATASREPTWTMARELQVEMFQEAAKSGLDVQLVFYRGRECQASPWISDASQLAKLMMGVECRTGFTQLGRVLGHVRKENTRQKVHALVFVGDAMEEQTGDLYAACRELGCPAFLFQEGADPAATETFCEVARLTKGAHCQFSPGAARELADLLRAVAAYAAGGRQALLANRNGGAVKLLQQLR